MKVIYCLLIIILASLYKAVDDERPKYCSDWRGENAPNETSQCFNLWINESRTKEYIKCCYETRRYYFQGEYNNMTRCVPLTKEEYDTLPLRVKSGINYYKSMGGIPDRYEFNCSSNYLYLSLLSLIIFLL